MPPAALPVRIAMWSGPRNISTALLRAWEHRPDTCVADEPLYAYYLAETGLDHPGRDAILRHHDADPQRVRNDLLQQEIITEDFGGDVLCVDVSALTGQGLDRLEEAIMLQSELLELKANPDRAADGVVVEAKVERGRGSVATVLVQRGILKQGDILVVGAESGRVRALLDDRGQKLTEAGPGRPGPDSTDLKDFCAKMRKNRKIRRDGVYGFYGFSLKVLGAYPRPARARLYGFNGFSHKVLGEHPGPDSTDFTV